MTSSNADTADGTVKEFVDSCLAPGSEKYDLSTLWEEYTSRYPNGVPKERFRHYLEQNLPLVCTWITPSLVVVGVQWSSGGDIPTASPEEDKREAVEEVSDSPTGLEHSLKWRVTPGRGKDP